MEQSTRANGISMRFAMTGKPGAPTVILGHALAANLSMWKPQLTMLERSFSVLSYDIRGHGGTEATPGDYSLALLAADVLALMDALEVQSAHYVGLSLGGMVGQYLGAWHGERFTSLTLCATTSNAPRASWDARVKEVRSLGVAVVAQSTVDRWVNAEFQRENPAMTDALQAMVLGTSLNGYAGSAAAIRDMELDAAIERISIPTLVIAGEADTSTPLPALVRIADAIPGAQLLAVPGATHMPTMERPDLCNSALERFLLACSNSR